MRWAEGRKERERQGRPHAQTTAAGARGGGRTSRIGLSLRTATHTNPLSRSVPFCRSHFSLRRVSRRALGCPRVCGPLGGRGRVAARRRLCGRRCRGAAGIACRLGHHGSGGAERPAAVAATNGRSASDAGTHKQTGALRVSAAANKLTLINVSVVSAHGNVLCHDAFCRCAFSHRGSLRAWSWGWRRVPSAAVVHPRRPPPPWARCPRFCS